ncbi:MAG TPA: cytochrome P460 family protein, partial [Terriglobales bacterium]
EWVYLSSGLDMSYTARVASAGDHSMFDNVFVNPEAYKAFKETGTWPDKTMMVLEVRMAETAASINRNGRTQGGELMGVEVHVKDQAKFANTKGWAFYGFDKTGAGEKGDLLPATASCYSCHEQHGAVDTSFVQFYPTLLPIAKQKNTLSASYVKDEAASKQTGK